MSNLIQPDSVWEYKGQLYRVNSVMERNLIQYNDEWHHTVRYTCEPQTGLVFYRSTQEWLEKFTLISE